MTRVRDLANTKIEYIINPPMPIDLLVGSYLYLSVFFASFIFISAILVNSHTNTVSEKLIFSYLLSVTFITISLIGLNAIPQGITVTNSIYVSQTYLLISLLTLFLRQKDIKINFKKPHFGKIFKEKLLILLIIIFSLDVLSSIWSIYLLPVTEGDSLAYHLQAPPNWYQDKNLSIYPTNDYRHMIFPDNQNFLVLWNFLSYKNEALIEIIPYFYLLLGVLVVFCFLQKLQKNTRLNLALSFLFYYVWANIAYSRTFSGDTGVTTLTITSLFMLYSYLQSRKIIYLLFLSIAGGLLMGIKTPGALHIGILYGAALIFEIFILKRKARFKALTPYLISFVLCLLIGGFQYFRNWQYFYNPFFPKELTILGLINLPGFQGDAFGVHGPSVRRMIETSLILVKSFFQGAFGFQFPLFYIPSALVLFIFYRKKIDKMTWLVILCLFTIIILFLFALYGNATRYFLTISFLGIVCFATLIKMIDKKFGEALFVLVSVFIIIAPSEGKSLSRFQELFALSQVSFEERQPGKFFYDSDVSFFTKNIPVGSDIIFLLPENVLLYPFYGPHYENRLVFANSSDSKEIINTVKNQNIQYLMAKSKGSDYNHLFFRWNLKEGKLFSLLEEDARNAVAYLTQNEYISEIGSGSRISFYKINMEKINEN